LTHTYLMRKILPRFKWPRLITNKRVIGDLHVRLPACPARNKPQTSQDI